MRFQLTTADLFPLLLAQIDKTLPSYGQNRCPSPSFEVQGTKSAPAADAPCAGDLASGDRNPAEIQRLHEGGIYAMNKGQALIGQLESAVLKVQAERVETETTANSLGIQLDHQQPRTLEPFVLGQPILIPPTGL